MSSRIAAALEALLLLRTFETQCLDHFHLVTGFYLAP